MTEHHQTPPEQALKDIERRLDVLRRETPEKRPQSSDGPHSVYQLMWLAFNVVSDLVAGLVCGLGIGYGIDHYFGTRPVFIAVFLILGCIAGVLNVIRFLRQYEERQREKQLNIKEKE